MEDINSKELREKKLFLETGIKQSAKDYWIGIVNDYRDDGKVSPKARTKKFSVFHKKYKSLIGFIKWQISCTGYAFFPLVNLLEVQNMREIASFCEYLTLKQYDVAAEQLRKTISKKRKVKIREKVNGPSKFTRTINRRARDERNELLERKKILEEIVPNMLVEA